MASRINNSAEPSTSSVKDIDSASQVDLGAKKKTPRLSFSGRNVSSPHTAPVRDFSLAIRSNAPARTALATLLSRDAALRDTESATTDLQIAESSLLNGNFQIFLELLEKGFFSPQELASLLSKAVTVDTSNFPTSIRKNGKELRKYADEIEHLLIPSLIALGASYDCLDDEVRDALEQMQDSVMLDKMPIHENAKTHESSKKQLIIKRFLEQKNLHLCTPPKMPLTPSCPIGEMHPKLIENLMSALTTLKEDPKQMTACTYQALNEIRTKIPELFKNGSFRIDGKEYTLLTYALNHGLHELALYCINSGIDVNTTIDEATALDLVHFQLETVPRYIHEALVQKGAINAVMIEEKFALSTIVNRVPLCSLLDSSQLKAVVQTTAAYDQVERLILMDLLFSNPKALVKKQNVDGKTFTLLGAILKMCNGSLGSRLDTEHLTVEFLKQFLTIANVDLSAKASPELYPELTNTLIQYLVDVAERGSESSELLITLLLWNCEAPDDFISQVERAIKHRNDQILKRQKERPNDNLSLISDNTVKRTLALTRTIKAITDSASKHPEWERHKQQMIPLLTNNTHGTLDHPAACILLSKNDSLQAIAEILCQIIRDNFVCSVTLEDHVANKLRGKQFVFAKGCLGQNLPLTQTVFRGLLQPAFSGTLFRSPQTREPVREVATKKDDCYNNNVRMIDRLADLTELLFQLDPEALNNAREACNLERLERRNHDPLAFTVVNQY